MRHPGPIRREEPPARKPDLFPVTLSIGAMALGLGFIAYCLHDGGVIGSQTLLISLVLLITVAGCAFIVLDSSLTARPPAARDDEVPPPFDFYLVWPPDGLLQDAGSARPPANDVEPPERKRP